MSNDFVILRNEIKEELQQLQAREKELQERLSKIYLAEAEERAKKDTVDGRTNACTREGMDRFNLGPVHWRSDDTCSYCGSMTVAEAIKLLTTDGTDYSGADWKYGWPHKFYIGRRKFYNNHIVDGSPEEVAAFNEISQRLFGVEWHVDPEKGLGWKAPRGIQKYGVVGKQGE